ncbi:MAG TPA: HD domain-containing phosphohydrolase [Terracidiphilus sp.]|nr:HD domain-containing phosphohydrolase [Terracidiphilus sp.]
MFNLAVNNASTILVADDNEINRELLSDILTGEGYKVVCVEDGDQALHEIQTRAIDLALLDVIMPGKTGFDICQFIKSRPETRLIPVVLVTGLTSVDERIRGIRAGADDFLSKPVNSQELLARTRSLLRLKEFIDELENAETVLFSLALSIEAKDPYTKGHCDRLSAYSEALGQRLGLPHEQCVALRRAGVVHDIGKIGVPEHILLKNGALNDAEWIVMKEHPITGERICSPLKSFRLVLPIIRHHHEKLDGSGYPDRLKGDEIPLTARILQVTDIYDALVTDRPYRKALSHEEAIETMRGEARRGWWDNDLIDEFGALLGYRAPVVEEIKVAHVF